MFNNAGVLGPTGPIDELPMDEFDRVYSINVKGPFMGVKHAARVMKPAGKGCIITTSSIAGHWGAIGPHAYGACKHALGGLVKNAAYELRKFNIRVNNISPGAIKTPIWSGLPESFADKMAIGVVASPENRGVATAIETPDVIANAVLFLASDASSFVSGYDLVVDGRHYLIPPSPNEILFSKTL